MLDVAGVAHPVFSSFYLHTLESDNFFRTPFGGTGLFEIGS